MSEFNALTIAQIIAALRAENQSLHAERDEANRVCEQWRQWSAGDQARIAELEADAARYRWLRGRAYKDGETLALEVAVIDDLAIGDFGEFIDASIDNARASASAPVAHSKSQQKRFAAMDRPCTCPPNERPWPCTGQYALHECRRVAREQSVGNLRPGPPTEAVK